MAGSSTEASEDCSLMHAIAKGDRAALSKLYDRHSPMILAICRRVLRDANEAEDVLTDIFFEVWTKADRFDASRGSPLTYLVTLSRSRAIDRETVPAPADPTSSAITPMRSSQADGTPNPLAINRSEGAP